MILNYQSPEIIIMEINEKGGDHATNITVTGEILDVTAGKICACICVYVGTVRIFIETGSCTWMVNGSQIASATTTFAKIAAMTRVWDDLFSQFLSGDLCAGSHVRGPASMTVADDTVIIHSRGISVEFPHSVVALLRSETEKILLRLGVEKLTEVFLGTNFL